MRNEQVEIARLETVAVEHAARDFLRLSNRELEHRVAVLLDIMQPFVHRLVRRRAEAPARRHAERRAAAAVDLVLEIEDRAIALSRRSGYDGRAGAVTEQDAPRAIVVIDDPGQ